LVCRGDTGNKPLRNVGKYLPIIISSDTRINAFLSKPLRQPKILEEVADFEEAQRFYCHVNYQEPKVG
jgi:hypothetical protein